MPRRSVGSLQTLDRPVALEGESKVSLDRIVDHTLSWAQWFADSDAPGVLRARAYERRHMLHHTRRWNRDHSDEIQSAWLNGCGVLLWENVFGSWVGWNDRDAAMYRRMVTVFRAFPDVLIRGDWTPLADLGPHRPARVFGSRFAWRGIDLVLMVNRDPDPVSFSWTPAAGRDAVCLDTGTAEVALTGRGIAAVVEYDLAATGVAPGKIAEVIAALAADPASGDSGLSDADDREDPGGAGVRRSGNTHRSDRREAL